jgi:hypothetical protein
MVQLIESDNFIIDSMNGFAKVKFSKDYYDKNIIFEVCSEFSDNIYFSILENESSFEVIFVKKVDDDFASIVFEYFNYLIGVTMSKIK